MVYQDYFQWKQHNWYWLFKNKHYIALKYLTKIIKLDNLKKIKQSIIHSVLEQYIGAEGKPKKEYIHLPGKIKEGFTEEVMGRYFEEI